MLAKQKSKSPSETFRRLTSQRHLRDIFTTHVEKGNVRGRDGIAVSAVAADLTQTAKDISRLCRTGRYHFTTYRQKLILKGPGQYPRELSIPTVRDRVTLRALTELLISTFPESAGKLPQASVAAVMADLTQGQHDAFIRVDVKNFYPSIDHDFLLQKIENRVKKREVLRLIRSAIATPTASDRAARPRRLSTVGVPQGLSIANPLAELYLASLDQAMGARTGISYHRFVDDILILCQSADAQIVDLECRAALTSLQLEAHPPDTGGKSQVGSVADGFTYLGYVFNGTRVGVRTSSIMRLEAHLASIHATWQHELERGVDAQTALHRFFWHRNLAITGCVFQGNASGWIQYFRQLNDLKLLKRLDATVMRLGTRYSAPISPPPKTFMRAYWVIRHPRSRSAQYVPNFDLYSLSEMARDLTLMGADITNMSNDEVKDSFYRMVAKAVRDLEHDVGDLS